MVWCGVLCVPCVLCCDWRILWHAPWLWHCSGATCSCTVLVFYYKRLGVWVMSSRCILQLCIGFHHLYTCCLVSVCSRQMLELDMSTVAKMVCIAGLATEQGLLSRSWHTTTSDFAIKAETQIYDRCQITFSWHVHVCNVAAFVQYSWRHEQPHNGHQQIWSSCNSHADASVGTALVHVVASLCITLYDDAVRICKIGANIHRCLTELRYVEA